MAEGVTFRETMSGPVALGAADPESGAAAGGAETLTMRVTFAIEDLERFLSDPAYAGGLSGEVEHGPLGGRLPAPRGAIRLVQREEPPTLGMAYELELERAGERLHFAGMKTMSDDPGLDVWSDATTLHVIVRRGGPEGEPLAAGKIRMGVDDVARLVASMRPTGTSGPIEAARVIERFASFYLRRIRAVYG